MSWIELVAQRRPPTAPPGMQPPENAKDWFRIENSVEDEDTTDVFVYDSIGGWFGLYADDFIEAIGEVKSSKMNLRLNSPGGSVFEGIAIANAIRNHPANVTVYVDGLAASIASVIALAGDKVVMMPQSQFMVHNASGGCFGDATEMTKMADMLDKQSRNIAEAYAQHTGRPLAEWQAYMEAETWFTAAEAVEVGLADEAMPMRKTQPQEQTAKADLSAVMNRTWDLSMYQYSGRESAPAPTITACATAEAEPVVEEQPVTEPALTRDELIALIRETVRAEFEDAAKKKLPPFLQPDEDEEDDDESDDDEDGEKPAPKKSSPKSEAEAEGIPAGDGAAPVEHATDTGLGTADGVESVETCDETDTWNSLVDRLTNSTSPSADDVFMSLKEGW